VIDPRDVALLAAIWHALEEHGGDERYAAEAVWGRLKANADVREALLRNIEALVYDTGDIHRLAEQVLRDPGAPAAFRERIEAKASPTTEDRVGRVVVGGFLEIIRMATEAWHRERERREGFR
jgi:hypothetical protein